jgi:hypothetical protein
MSAVNVPTVFEVTDHHAEYRQHIVEHDTYLGGSTDEGCPFCAAATLLPDLHAAWFHGTTEQYDLLLSMQDGYGIPGYVANDGDWSGVRDSTPATVYLMWCALKAQTSSEGDQP